MPAPAALTYAIGDVHGRFDLLETALAIIARHGRGRGRRLIFLGDYVDRGPQSREVIERLVALSAAADAECLKGNHEVMMIDALREGGARNLDLWRRNGGLETLASYGRAADGAPGVPPSHLAWMADLPLFATDEHRVYVHAGLAPGVALEDQTEEACLWIREAFLRAGPAEFDRHVVHGHTPYWRGKPDPSRPERLGHRTNLDTGAFATGILSIGVFDPAAAGGPVEILAAQGPAGAPVVRTGEPR